MHRIALVGSLVVQEVILVLKYLSFFTVDVGIESYDNFAKAFSDRKLHFL